MLKRLLSLNLALIILLSLVPTRGVTAYAMDDIGYANFSANYDGGETIEKAIPYFSSNGALRLYEDMPEFTRNGYALVGYNSKPDGSGISYSSAQAIREIYSKDSSSAPMLYAQWKEVTGLYILYRATEGSTVDGNDYYLVDGLSAGPVTLADQNTFISGEEVTVSWRDNISTWWANTFFPSDAYQLVESVVLYGTVGINAIRFHYKNWRGDQLSSITSYKDNSEIGNNVLATQNYSQIFLGWNENVDGSGEWYPCKAKVRGVPQELYAQYASIPQEDYYVLNTSLGLENGQESTVVLSSSNVPLPQTVCAGEVAYWTGRVLSSDMLFSNDVYFAGGAIPNVPSGTRLASVHSGETYYAIIVDGNGGETASGSPYFGFTCHTVVTSPGQLTPKTVKGSNLGSFTKEGYALIGYEDAAKNDVLGFNDFLTESIANTVTESGIVRYRAVYEQVIGNYVQYIGNGGVTEDGNDYFIQDGLDFSSEKAEKYIDAPFFRFDGKRFLGWNTEADGDGDWYDPGTEIAADKNQVLYAQWGAARVVYHKNNPGVNPVIATRHQVLEECEKDVLLQNETTTFGNDLFAGWNSEEDGSGVYYTAGRRAAVPEAYPVINVYAQWEHITPDGNYYILTADALASGRLAEVVEMTDSSEAITLPANVDSSTKLLGWYTLPQNQYKGFVDELSNFYLPGEETTVTRGMRLYGCTEITNTCVVYHGNGAVTDNNEGTRTEVLLATSAAALVLYNVEDVFDTIPDEKRFISWNTKQDGSGVDYPVGTCRYPGDAALELFAQWEEVPYIVIDGVKYDATQNASGDGWIYRFIKENEGVHKYYLNLRNYEGGPIYSSTDLCIDLMGKNIIKGSDSCGVSCQGDLTVYSVYASPLGRGSLIVSGDEGFQAISAEGELTIPCSITATGGNTAAFSATKIKFFTTWPVAVSTGSTEMDATERKYIDDRLSINIAYNGETYYHSERLPYELTLNGNGGKTVDGLDSCDVIFTEGTPGRLFLYYQKDTFENEGKELVGWSEVSDPTEATIHPIDEEYAFPRGSLTATLYAVWKSDMPSDPGSSFPGNITQPTHGITVESSSYGDVKVWPKEAQIGSTVTITATPDEGYVVDEVIVADMRGNELLLAEKGNGVFTFRMPNGDVTIKVIFRPVSDGNGAGPSLTIAAPDGWVNPYTDVPVTAWYYDAVGYATANGLMGGTSATTFAPESTMNRAMVWTVIARLAGQTVTGPTWAEDAEAWAVAQGVSDGADPDGNVTREELVTMLYRYAGSPAVGTSELGLLGRYPDADIVSDWAQNAMAWAVSVGVINGRDGRLAAGVSLTRAEATAILGRIHLMDVNGRKSL